MAIHQKIFIWGYIEPELLAFQWKRHLQDQKSVNILSLVYL
jgi:hypothetical protein